MCARSENDYYYILSTIYAECGCAQYTINISIKIIFKYIDRGIKYINFFLIYPLQNNCILTYLCKLCGLGSLLYADSWYLIVVIFLFSLFK